jgi:iron(III) transport system ATP-binding protein
VGRATFIDVTRVETGRGWVTPSGIPIDVDESAVNGGGVYQAMLRPEGIEILEKSDIAEPGRSLPGVISDSQYLGAYTEYLVDAGGAKVKVHSKRDFDIGSPVTLRFSPDNCRLVAVPDGLTK